MQNINLNARYFLFGFSLWKHNFILPFFQVESYEQVVFCNVVDDLHKYNVNANDIICVWGRKSYTEVYEYARLHNIKIYVVEDGFIRSVSLGSDLTRPYSLVIDTRGIYFDPTNESDLEYILQNTTFDDELVERARNLIALIMKSKISKYNGMKHKKIELPDSAKQKKIILVTGQVEDDASIILGAYGQNTQDLLKTVRANNQDSFILYKPHPDVISGNRKGLNDDKIALLYCDMIVKDFSIDSCIEVCDELHTLTSTAGFDALIRGKKVYTYGMPFYAGWGLSVDSRINERRTKVITLEQLVAGVLILYPKYIYPKTHKFCTVEELLQEIIDMQEFYFNNKYYKFFVDTKTLILRKVRRVIEYIICKMEKQKC